MIEIDSCITSEVLTELLATLDNQDGIEEDDV